MNVLTLREAYESEEDKELGLIKAAKLLKPDCVDFSEAQVVISMVVHRLLDQDRFPEAGTLLWGERVFTCKPYSVRQINDLYHRSGQGIILGASSMGKSYTLMALVLMDWVRDPEWTSVKIISTTAGHSKSNTFSTIVALHKSAIIQLPGKCLDGFIGLDSTGDKRSSISVVAIPAGDDGKGRLQGFHPVPRTKRHPRFGEVSRIRAILDEAEEVPMGVWQGIDNLMGSKEGDQVIKVMMATNPKNVASLLARAAEPDGGWEAVDIDTDHEWKSKEGWDVVRVDAAFSENVIEKETVYHSMQTFEGYERLKNKHGGNTPEYYTFARAIYPPSGIIDTIISGELITRARGDFTFSGISGLVLGVDIAVDGRDLCVAAMLRYGIATGFTPIKGVEDKFPHPRFCVQLEHLQVIPKGETKKVGDNIRIFAKGMSIGGKYVGVDRTGNGASVHDYLKAIWDEDVYGLDFRDQATELKILEEDTEIPRAEYTGIVTEVWFALRKYLQAESFSFSKSVQMDVLRRELIGRRYEIDTGKKIKVEDKDKFKKRYGRSPDFADAVTIGLHRIRELGQDLPTITGTPKPKEEEQYFEPKFELPEFQSIDLS